MKTVFITGGRGFIGRNLAETLEKKGYRILAPSSAELSLLDEQAVDAFMRKQPVDIIVHAANKGGGRDTMGMVDVVHTNLRMFFNIVKYADSVEKIIHFGSGAEYGKHKAIVMVEEDEARVSIPHDDYGFYKSVCSRYIEHSGKNIINLRIFGCYGKYEDYRYKFISNAIVKNLLGMPIRIRQNVLFDYVYVADLMKMVLWAMTSDTFYKVYNITRGEGVELIALAELVNAVAAKPTDIIIETLGLNLEYTASNGKILKECPMEFCSHYEGVAELYRYYAENLIRVC
ncbi:NAD-dependent epimerase/dehydratase family protein [Chlorobium sp. N1]|uniref:NAD-dependent epimerase/dehydratase family protein n=1 Tax=Chlorobium sp. N1 TaxID=2491138 RepID=UPI001039AAAD|nr:NAD-dependent epimerase/dehydratase family protein [Chlorobium sp. N1]TCD47957.1 SDR family oxidoreductase [Chlorobium sp. N1]